MKVPLTGIDLHLLASGFPGSGKGYLERVKISGGALDHLLTP